MKHWHCLLVSFLVLCCLTYSHGQEESLVPGSDFNSYVIALLQSYPSDGTHQYYWPSQSDWKGNTRDLFYRDTLFAKGDTYSRCYCCGLTFEVFFRAYEKYCHDKGAPFIIKDFDITVLNRFLRQWFGADGNLTTLQNAIVANALGKAVSHSEAQAGDFVQLWRHSGSGHSVIFINWVKNNNDQVVGFRYWSTQKATNGIGYNTEYFGTSGSTLDSNRLYIARVGK
jgi:hypothetical protein